MAKLNLNRPEKKINYNKIISKRFISILAVSPTFFSKPFTFTVADHTHEPVGKRSLVCNVRLLQERNESQGDSGRERHSELHSYALYHQGEEPAESQGTYTRNTQPDIHLHHSHHYPAAQGGDSIPAVHDQPATRRKDNRPR